MKRIHGNLSELEPLSEPVALTLGNFDGVHKGHQFLINRLVKVASEERLASAVLCFSPHPAKVLGDDSFDLLMADRDKEKHLESLGVDYLIIQDFSCEFSKISAEDFLRQYLAYFFHLEILSIGYDFRFGSKGSGDFVMMKEFFMSQSIKVVEEPPFFINEVKPSSSQIRTFLKQGNVAKAMNYLGYPYFLSGVVKAGKAIGRTIGFPTANLSNIATLIPGDGVYFCFASCQGEKYQAMVNIGRRPTFSGDERTVEAHLLNFSGDIYDQEVTLEFLEKVRAEKSFLNVDELKAQLAIDLKNAEIFFEKHS